jgi:uncharacterized protein (AIM24 family)
MLFMTSGVEMSTSLNSASSAFARFLTGQNLFLTDFTYNGTSGQGTVALGTDFPSKILRLSLEDHGGSLIAQRYVEVEVSRVLPNDSTAISVSHVLVTVFPLCIAFVG